MNSTVKAILIAAAVILIGVGIYYGNKHAVPNEVKVQRALANLVSESPTNKDYYDALVKKGFVIHDGIIDKDKDLAHTDVRSDGSVTITVDANEVLKFRDRLEPIIAHELQHAYDALVTYGVDKFIEIANSEKNLPWEKRTLEKSAIEWENLTRQYLLATYKKEYSGMASTRQFQNRRPQ